MCKLVEVGDLLFSVLGRDVFLCLGTCREQGGDNILVLLVRCLADFTFFFLA